MQFLQTEGGNAEINNVIKQPETSHYVYKFVLNGEVIYVGKSDTNSFSRIEQHGKSGDNIAKKYWDELNTSDVWYYCLPTKTMCDVVESELIRRLKPKCNKAKKRVEWQGLIFPEFAWRPYRVFSPCSHNSLINEVLQLETEKKHLLAQLHKQKEIAHEREKNMCIECIRGQTCQFMPDNTSAYAALQRSDDNPPITWQDIEKMYREGRIVDYISLAYDIYGNIVCQKRIYTSLYKSLDFEFHQTGTKSARGTLLYNKDDPYKSYWNVFRCWENRGSSLYYKLSFEIEQAVKKGRILCQTK